MRKAEQEWQAGHSGNPVGSNKHAIMESCTRRSEFAAILKTEGVDGLTSALNRKAEFLAMSAARTFYELPFEFPAAIRHADIAIAGIAFTPKATRSGGI